MNASDLLARLQEQGIGLSVTPDGRLRLTGASAAALTPHLRAQVEDNRVELLTVLGAQRAEPPAMRERSVEAPEVAIPSGASTSTVTSESGTPAVPAAPSRRPARRAAGSSTDARTARRKRALPEQRPDVHVDPVEPPPPHPAVEPDRDNEVDRHGSDGHTLAWLLVGLVGLVGVVWIFVSVGLHPGPTSQPTEPQPPAAFDPPWPGFGSWGW